MYTCRLGESNKLRLTGRPLDRDVELLSTSKLYHLGQKFVVFTPQVEQEDTLFVTESAFSSWIGGALT